MKNTRLSHSKITIFDFYSIWITIYLVVFLVVNLLADLPQWLSPFYAVIGACLGQVVMFIVGWKAQPRWYIVASIIWKLSILILALLLTNKKISIENTLWLSICFLSYLLYIEYQKNKNFKNIYYDAMRNPKTYQNLLQNIKNLFPFLF